METITKTIDKDVRTLKNLGYVMTAFARRGSRFSRQLSAFSVGTTSRRCSARSSDSAPAKCLSPLAGRVQ